jgi:hypothetical protein
MLHVTIVNAKGDFSLFLHSAVLFLASYWKVKLLTPARLLFCRCVPFLFLRDLVLQYQLHLVLKYAPVKGISW